MENSMEHVYSICFMIAGFWTIFVMVKIELVVAAMVKKIEEGSGTLSMVESVKELMAMRWKLFIVVFMCTLGIFL